MPDSALSGPIEARVPSGPIEAHVPSPRSERLHLLVALAIGAVGVAVLAAVLSGLVGRSSPAAVAPPPVIVTAATPAPAAPPTPASKRIPAAQRVPHAAIVAQPSAAQQQLDATRFIDQTQTQISARWMEGFYPIYAVAQKTFGVNWLLIASIHRQESAFSTAPSTYHGLNFARCCGGPMQFNVTNGPVTTWALVADSYIYGRRPASYDHKTATHPSIYDDFDAIMAAAHLLSADGAEYALNGAAWDAAYDYYGHDETGVTYADQVLARAIEWSQHGFCVNCGVDPAMVEAVNAAYGAPVLEALRAEALRAEELKAETQRAARIKAAQRRAAQRRAAQRPAAAQPAAAR